MTDDQLNLSISSSKKKRWKQAAKESEEYSSLTHLVKLSVEQELSDDGEDEIQTQNLGFSAEIADSVDRISDQLDFLERKISTIEENTEQDMYIDDIKDDVLDTLPSANKNIRRLDPGESILDVLDCKTAKQIADEIGAKKNRVEHTLNTVLKQYGFVRTHYDEETDRVYYYEYR